MVMIGVAPVAAQTTLNFGKVTLTSGGSPSAARIGDLDGDGRNDVAVTTLQGGLQLFYGAGGTAFQQVSLDGLWPGVQAVNLAIGDLDNDGRNDIAVALSTSGGAVSVVRNLGNRTFAAPVTYSTCNGTNSVAIGDLDNDGDNDLAVTGQCSQAAVLLNNGQGAFTSGGSFGSGSSARAVTVADFSRDGYLDIAFLNATTFQATVTVLFNQRNGTFGSPLQLYAGDLPVDFTAGDFDADGSQDIAIANPYLGQVIVHYNDSAGTLLGGSIELTLDTPDSIAVGRFNADGLDDLVVGSRNLNAVSVLLSRNLFNFGGGTSSGAGLTPIAVAAGRLDGDAISDIAAVNAGGTVTVLLSTIPPPPPPPVQIILNASTRISGNQRLVELQWSGVSTNFVDVYRNNLRLATVWRAGPYTDRFNRKAHGSFTYRVCDAGTSRCSNSVTVTF
jgi:hypothetical protein